MALHLPESLTFDVGAALNGGKISEDTTGYAQFVFHFRIKSAFSVIPMPQTIELLPGDAQSATPLFENEEA